MRKNSVLTFRDKLADTVFDLPVENNRVSLNARLGTRFRVVLGGDATLEIHGGHTGQVIYLRIVQNAIGGFTLALGGANLFTLGDVILDADPAASTLWELLYDVQTGFWHVRGIPDLSALYDAAGTATAAVAAHVAAGNPHPAYLLSAVAAVTYAPIRRPTLAISDDRTLVAGSDYIVNSAAARVETLPAAPADGDEITVKRVGVDTVTIGQGGKLIEGAAADLVLGTTLLAKRLRYEEDTGSWWVL